jgi:hypothetical protein
MMFSWYIYFMMISTAHPKKAQISENETDPYD